MNESTRTSNSILKTAGIVIVVAACTSTVFLYARKTQNVAAEKHARVQSLQEGTPVLVSPVQMQPSERQVTLPGELRPFKVTTVYAKVSGYLKDIYVDKGDQVKYAQALGQVESPETDQQVLSMQADLVVKKQIYDRYKTLVGSGVISAQEMDNAEANLHSVTAQLDGLKALKSYETIRAPFDGIITARYADPGALLPAATGSTQSAQPLVEIQDMSKVRLFVYVGQSEAPYVHVGDNAKITSDNDTSIHLTAPITRIAHALDLRTRTMLVEIDLENKERLLYPGLYVNVTLSIHAPKELTVPSEAIFMRHGLSMVAVVEDQTVKYTQVEVISDDGHIVHVTSGLSEGQKVGLHVGDAISDGSHVKPIDFTEHKAKHN